MKQTAQEDLARVAAVSQGSCMLAARRGAHGAEANVARDSSSLGAGLEGSQAFPSTSQSLILPSTGDAIVGVGGRRNSTRFLHLHGFEIKFIFILGWQDWQAPSVATPLGKHQHL